MKNIIVGQSGGPTAVINSSLCGVYSMAKQLGAGKVYGMVNGIEGLIAQKTIDLDTYLKTDLDLEILKRTPSSFLGSCRYKLPKIEEAQVYENIFTILQSMEIDCFFYIGGNDSMDTIMKLSVYGESIKSPIRFIGVPKTVDNDLAVTDHSPGFGSAAKFIATTMKEIILDAHVYANNSITLVEVMGRNAGWLTAAAALCKSDDSIGPDALFLPESVFDLDCFMDKADKLAQNGCAVIVISEGIKTADGKYVQELGKENAAVDSFGHRQLSGTAHYLSGLISSKLGRKTRAIEFATLQRAAAHIASATDVNEAFNLGKEAVKTAADNKTNKVVIITRLSSEPYIYKIDAIDIKKIANIEKKIPLEWIKNDYITNDFIEYAFPLIQGEYTPYYVNGIPRHIKL